VTWVHSYLTEDKKKTFCIYDALTPEAMHRVADRDSLPVDRLSVDRLTAVRVFDLYCSL
jgi:hypothetical protein